MSIAEDERPDEGAPEQAGSDEVSSSADQSDVGGAATPPTATPEPATEASEGGTAPDAPSEEPATSADADAPADSSSAPIGEPAESPKDSDKKAPKPKDVAPGADLDPIAITTERELTAEERARVEAEAEEKKAREAEAVGDLGEDELAAQERKTVSVPADARIQATGKRKRAVARVILRSGDGKVKINDRALEEYFPRDYHRTLARQPLVAAGYDGSVDISVRVHGGGVGGQAGAVRHGIARALCEVDPELRGELKRRGMLTRDARMKERRKAGLKKARKRPQFSKR